MVLVSRAVGAGLPVLAAVHVGAGQDLLPLGGEDHLGVLGHRAGRPVDVADDVLGDGGGGPQELAGLAVERVDEAGLARNAGHHLADLAGLNVRVDPAHRVGVGRHRGVEQDALEGVVEVPVVVHVLVVPPNLAGIDVEGQRGVVVEVRVLDAAEHELGGRRGDRRALVDEAQLGVVAGRHPGADVDPLLVGHAAPGFVARFPGGRHRPAPPQLLAGARVVRDDDARFGAAARPAAPPGDRLAVGDDRPRAVSGRGLPVVEDLRLPGDLAGRGVEAEHVAVVAGVDDEAVVDGDVAVVAGVAADVLVDVLGQIAPVRPDQVACRRVDRVDDVARLGHVEDAAVRQGRAFLAPGRQRARPDHAQIANVAPVDLVQRAVGPAVERPAPRQPVAGGGVLEHRVGHRYEVVGGLGLARCRNGSEGNGEGHERHRDERPAGDRRADRCSDWHGEKP